MGKAPSVLDRFAAGTATAFAQREGVSRDPLSRFAEGTRAWLASQGGAATPIAPRRPEVVPEGEDPVSLVQARQAIAPRGTDPREVRKLLEERAKRVQAEQATGLETLIGHAWNVVDTALPMSPGVMGQKISRGITDAIGLEQPEDMKRIDRARQKEAKAPLPPQDVRPDTGIIPGVAERAARGAEEFRKSFIKGVGNASAYALEQTGRLAIGGDNNILTKTGNQIRQDLEAAYPPDPTFAKGTNPFKEGLTLDAVESIAFGDLPQGLGSTVPFLALSAISVPVVAALGLKGATATLASGALPALLGYAMQGGVTYDEAIAEGLDPESAMAAANLAAPAGVLEAYFPMQLVKGGGLSRKLVNLGRKLNNQPIQAVLRDPTWKREMTEVLLNAGKAGVGGFIEEGLQETISSAASQAAIAGLKDPTKGFGQVVGEALTSPETRLEGLIGGFTGKGMSATEAVASTQQRQAELTNARQRRELAKAERGMHERLSRMDDEALRRIDNELIGRQLTYDPSIPPLREPESSRRLGWEPPGDAAMPGEGGFVLNPQEPAKPQPVEGPGFGISPASRTRQPKPRPESPQPEGQRLLGWEVPGRAAMPGEGGFVLGPRPGPEPPKRPSRPDVEISPASRAQRPTAAPSKPSSPSPMDAAGKAAPQKAGAPPETRAAPPQVAPQPPVTRRHPHR